MKKNLILLFALITTVAFGQNNNQDVVYLENGSIIQDVAIEQTPNKSIEIETADRNVFVYQMNGVEELEEGLLQGKSGNSLNNSGFQYNSRFQPGYKGIVEFGCEVGIGDYGMDRLKLNIINGYQVNSRASLGFGTGVRYYFDAEATLIPIFADFRATFMDTKVSPYVSAGIGYSFDATNGFEGVGFIFSPTVGVSFKISERSALNVGIGYEMQQMEFYYYDYYSIYFFKKLSDAISINVGISF